ncbi:MAG: branched-chain amino acid ABC transporter permease [Thermogemmatispora sp.]|uniref:branched-chain amino acid ABC transporter permease n=1 Tax=Thermogemmatispora TaxID=768669 RepID=UPI00124EF711|nr:MULTISPECIES: branched-chain amino acid ABC transporter permease [Thermogemmatispora]MBE3566116.1 branched-chain amino acid ABC transporter permease [Thermogemmatispora sp.]GER84169.1 branched-chain amino acid ABC transporter permease [Thermogemmatispora aurantia]
MLFYHLIDGFFLGGLYVTIALGLTLVFGVMNTVNLAQGEVLIGSAYLTYTLASLTHLDPLLCLLLVAPIMFVIGYLVQRLLLNPLIPRGQETLLVATFGLLLVAETLFGLIYGNNTLSLSASYTLTGVTIFGDTVRTIYVIALVAALLLVVGTHLLMTYLPLGKAIRAAAEDPGAAASIGINVPLVYGITFGLAAAISAVGGTLIGLSFGFGPTTGSSWLLRSFTVIVLGGMGSLWGTLLGGLLIGVLEEVAASVVGPQFRDLIVFAFLVIVLIVRPEGFFGQRVGVAK